MPIACAKSLRLSNPEHQRLVKAADALETLHDLDTPPDERGLSELCCFTMAAAAPATHCSSPRRKRRDDADLWRKALGFLREAKEPRLPFGGNDLLAARHQGRQGRRRNAELLETRWIEAGFPEDPESSKR